MKSKNYKKLVKKCYEEYKKIGQIGCPAFANEKISFNIEDIFGHFLKESIP